MSEDISIEHYCMKCDTRRQMLDAECVEVKHRTGYRGVCAVCGRGMFKFAGSKHKNRPAGYYEDRKRQKRIEKRREAVLKDVTVGSVVYISSEDDPTSEVDSGTS